MKRGILQSFPAKQFMAADNTNWWIINNTTDHPVDDPMLSSSLLPPYFLPQDQQLRNSPSPSTSNSSSVPLHAGWPCYQVPDQFPDSWSQLLMGGFVGEEEIGNFEQPQAKRLMNWEDSLHQSVGSSSNNVSFADVKHEIIGYRYPSEDFNLNSSIKQSWSSSSPSSCVTNFFNGSHNMMEFASSSNKVDRTSDCCSNTNGRVTKKPRLQHSASQAAFKVRKEKLGDRINALHQLVSPFGKTDTASVLLEAIGYIRFLQNQIEALSLPYMGKGSKKQQSSYEGVESLFSDRPDQDDKESKKDLTSKGLCLVPISCTLQVGSDNGADYWAPAFGSRFR